MIDAILKGLVSSASYLLSSNPLAFTKTGTADGAPSPSLLAHKGSTCSALHLPSPPSPSSPHSTCLPPSPHDAHPRGERGRWVRPLGYAERFMTAAHDHGCMTTVYALWLDARAPIDFEVIKQATSIMYRKLPHLRMSIGRHKGKLWWREIPREAVDVEELRSDDVHSTLESLLRRRYRMEEGPLWFTRFVPLQGEDECVIDNNHNLKYKYVCLFGFHHNVSDGTTNMKFCKVFLQVVNDLLAGREVDMRQEGVFATPLHDQIADDASSQWYLFTIFLKRFYKGILSYGAYVRNFTHIYRMPAENIASTRVLHHELDEFTTRNLLRRCKMEGVTLNSAFTAAANLTLYRMMADKNHSLDATTVSSLQAINMRRYWPKDAQPNTFGCHISMLDVGFATNRADLDGFWEYSRGVHSSLVYQLTTTQHPLKIQPISERLILIICSNSWLDWAGFPSTNDNHYTVTNMGDLTHTFPGMGEEVEVSRVLRSVSCHFMPTLCQHTLQTFRGRFCYSLDYYTQKLSRETATTYAQGIIDLLRKSIHTPN
ncbi:uncharacterized protein LOC122250700 [Penaeus japonicus]|uniref:uncharacterized protein LOC122250700 n=1 Tax=Penaeus japonicus TaxID=27405 RepID=UPI001C712F70|nr:uncharacterized protein LOC122250700 [Penaeus japonicus]XP_042868207.1 uncharacterized protein LOC122250700 [Penaeus japonicus]